MAKKPIAVTNAPGANWLKARRDEIKSVLKRSGKKQADLDRNRIEALTTVLRIVQVARGQDQRKLRDMLRTQIRAHYDRKGLNNPKKGTNQLIPVVRLCIPLDGANGDKVTRNYVGYLTFCILKKIPHNKLMERYAAGASTKKAGRPGPAPNSFSIKRLSALGHEIWNEQDKPSTAFVIKWPE